MRLQIKIHIDIRGYSPSKSCELDRHGRLIREYFDGRQWYQPKDILTF